jgi:anti-sigma B factor antagonist
MVDYFSMAVALGHNGARLCLRGELDLYATEELAARLDEVCASEPSVVVVDLSDLTFCDSCGVRALLDVAARCDTLRIDMCIVGTQPNVRRIFEMTDTAELLHVFDEMPK